MAVRKAAGNPCLVASLSLGKGTGLPKTVRSVGVLRGPVCGRRLRFEGV